MPASFISCPGRGPRAHFGRFLFSALSLRIFGEDITSAARDAAAKKKQQGETVPEVAADTPVLDENADASDLAEATGVDQASD